MKRTLVAAVLTAIVLGTSVVGFTDEEGRPPAAAAEATAPAADAKPADQMGCMPGGGCCGAAACKQAAAAAASGTSANGEAPAPGGCPCGKAKKTQ